MLGPNYAPILRQANGLNRAPLGPRHLGVPSGVSKITFEPLECLVQTLHLSCTNTCTVSKQTKMRFHMTHVTLEFHRVLSKWFLSLWHIWRKPSTYLASGLGLFPNGLNQGFTWASSLRSSMECIQNDFWAFGMFGTNPAPILTDTNIISKWTKMRFHMTHVT
jgi:hypothetical protein